MTFTSCPQAASSLGGQSAVTLIYNTEMELDVW